MAGKKSSSCSLSSGSTDEKGTPCGQHGESSEIVEEEELLARSVAASPLLHVTELSVASSSEPNAEEKTSKTAQELEAARDERASIRNLKLDARSNMRALPVRRGAVKRAIFESIHARESRSESNRLESFLQSRKECISLLQDITMLSRDINRMGQRTALTKLIEEATELVDKTEDIYSSLNDFTISPRWFSKSAYKKVRDSSEKFRSLSTHLEIEMKKLLIIEMTTDIERQFPEYAGGITSPAEEVIAQDSGIETKTDTIVKENEVGRCDNQESENAQEMERPIISANENEEIHPCTPAYNELEQKLKESLYDIHSFFNGWDWSEVANIVGNSELETLKEKSLVIKDENTVRVHDAIKSDWFQDTDGMALINASQIQALLEKKETKDIQRITGIWLLLENKGSPSMDAAKLDLMCHSLRVLALGKFGKVEGKCRGVFDKMVFFQAGIPQLPFKVGRIKKLRYFSFEHEDFQLQKGYSNEYGRLNSKLQYPRTLKMESRWGLSFEMTNTGKALKRMELYLREPKCRCLDGLHCKRSLLNLVSLWDLKRPGDPHDPYGFFVALKDALFGLKKLTPLEDLPHRLGNLICLGREINLLKHHEQSSIDLESLAHLMSILCSLEISSCSVSYDLQYLLRDFPFLQFSLARCSNLEKLLYGFGELKSLTVLNLQNCWLLKKLPEGLRELECLVELDLSFCCSLEDFCTDFHFLRSLQILKLTYCESLKKLPEDFHLLDSLQLLDLSFCCSLEDFCTNFHLLPSLQILNLTSCESLKKLPEDFHLLVSLQLLRLKFCKTLEGESMDKVTKCKKLETLFIGGSPMLEKRWEAMKKEGNQSSSLVVYAKEEGTSDKDNGAPQL